MGSTSKNNGQAGTRPKNQLQRTTLKTSRLLDYFSEKELTAQTGHPKRDWPLVVLNELVGNAIDAAEDVGVAPEIAVTVDKDGITVTDNGPGIPAATVAGVLDFRFRVSSREHYVSPTRGAQGNALKTLIAMPFVLAGGEGGRVDVTAHGVRHEINVAVDRIRQEPRPDRKECREDQIVKKGTRVKVWWPVLARSILEAAEGRFLLIASNYAFLNPHLALTVDWFGDRRLAVRATNPAWPKWLPSWPTSIHWYNVERLGRLLAGYVGDDESKGRDRTVREFIGEFDGLTGSARKRVVLEATGMSRQTLASLRNGDGLDGHKVGLLHAAMRANTRPVKPAALGLIGREHLEERFRGAGCEMDTFAYKKVLGTDPDGLPWVVEVAFAARASAFEGGPEAEEGDEDRRIIAGINWSPAVGANPFRMLGYESLDAILEDQRAGHDEPVVFLTHLACPQVYFTDRGKSAVVIDDEDDDAN